MNFNESLVPYLNWHRKGLTASGGTCVAEDMDTGTKRVTKELAGRESGKLPRNAADLKNYRNSPGSGESAGR